MQLQDYIYKGILIIMLCQLHYGMAQQDSQYTQYMYNTQVINPAYAGSRGVFSVNSIYRSQWVGLNGAPRTVQASLSTPISSRAGLGFSFVSDEIGPSKESLVNLDYSYTLPLNDNTLFSFGIKGGLSLLDVNFNDLIFDNTDPNSQNIDNRVTPTVGLGLYLHNNNNWYVGLSSPNLLKTEHYNEGIQNSEITEEIHAYLIAGYVFDLSERTKFKPTFLAKAVTGAPLALDFSANFLFNDRFTLGAAYRLDAAVSALAGFQVNDQIMIGYAYDYDTTELGNYNNGSHEVFLRFELFRNLNKIVNPRFY